jgi:hypothetical protein
MGSHGGNTRGGVSRTASVASSTKRLCTTTWKTNSEYQLDSIVRYPFEPLFSPLHHNGNAHTRSLVCVCVCVCVCVWVWVWVCVRTRERA